MQFLQQPGLDVNDAIIRGVLNELPPQHPQVEVAEHSHVPRRERETNPVSTGVRKRIWIDLDNSPHVPFFLPIVDELQKKGYEIILTARDSYQVSKLLEFYHLPSKVVGSHWGKRRILKIIGTCWRALRLLPVVIFKRPDLAISHGSRDQLISCFVLRIPALMIYDYEHTATMGFIRPDWLFSPQYIPESSDSYTRKR